MEKIFIHFQSNLHSRGQGELALCLCCLSAIPARGGAEISLPFFGGVRTPPCPGKGRVQHIPIGWEELQISLPSFIPCLFSSSTATLPCWVCHKENFPGVVVISALKLKTAMSALITVYWCDQCVADLDLLSCVIPLVKVEKMNHFDSVLRSCHFRSYSYACDTSTCPTARMETWLSLRFRAPVWTISSYFCIFLYQTWLTSNNNC